MEPNTGEIVEKMDVPNAYISARPIQFFIMSQFFPIYYWDFLCFHRDHHSLVYPLIQTHEYYQRLLNPNIKASLFRKDVHLCKGIVPLCIFHLETYYLRNMKIKNLDLHCYCSLINQEKLDVLCDFIMNIKERFPLSCFMETHIYLNLIKEKQIFIYVLYKKKSPLAIYFLKDAQIEYENVSIATGKVGGTLHCIGSFHFPIHHELFYQGFLHSLQNIIKYTGKNYNMIMFDNLGQNNDLLSLWKNKNTPVFSNKSAYYLYNMVVPQTPFNENNCVFLI